VTTTAIAHGHDATCCEYDADRREGGGFDDDDQDAAKGAAKELAMALALAHGGVASLAIPALGWDWRRCVGGGGGGGWRRRREPVRIAAGWLAT